MYGRSLLAQGPVLLFDISVYFAIIYLTRQPTGRCTLPVPVKSYHEIAVLIFLREQNGYFLWCRFRIATIRLAVARIIINSSYVLISISSFRSDSERIESCRLFGCPGKYIILLSTPSTEPGTYNLTNNFDWHIIYLTREPMTRWSLVAGK